MKLEELVGLGKPEQLDRPPTRRGFPLVVQRESSGPTSGAAPLFWRLIAQGAAAGRPCGSLHAWRLWERIAQRMWPALSPPGSRFGLLKLRVTSYRGIPLQLPDLIEIESGAPIAELHCDNFRILAMARSGQSMLAACRDDLRAMAAWAEEAPDIFQALFGVTVLGGVALRLGFYTRDLPLSPRVRATRLFMNGLLALYNQDGARRLGRGKTLRTSLQQVWMSRQELIRRYGSQWLKVATLGSPLANSSARSDSRCPFRS